MLIYVILQIRQNCCIFHRQMSIKKKIDAQLNLVKINYLLRINPIKLKLN